MHALPNANEDSPSERKSGLYPARFRGKSGYIDSSGRVVIEPRFDVAFEFHEGRALVVTQRQPEPSDYEVIDEQGNVVFSGLKTPLGDHYFSEGFIPFLAGAKVGYLDRMGKVAISPRFYIEEDDD